MDYKQTIDYLYDRLPMFSRIGADAIKKDLTNTFALCSKLGNPQSKFKSIHVAGTNGKGSTSHMLAAILQQAGYKTGLYTSPHLYDFRERFRLNGQLIPEEFVIDFTKRIRPAIDDIEPSFFEITVAMAFDYFAQAGVDIAVIETGLGGRLDSTNIISPEIAVITNIGWDHMNLLGNSLEQIAAEKAGIIKKNIPVVIGEKAEATSKVFELKARAESAPIYFANDSYSVADWKYERQLLHVSVDNLGSGERENYVLDLPGYYQTKNLLTVLETVKQLQARGWKITREHCKAGLAHAKKLTGLHGRWELLQHKPDIIVDVAHNEDGMRQVAAQLELCDYQHLHIVIGMVKDKAIENVLRYLPREANFYFTRSQIPRALPEAQLMAIGHSLGLKGKSFPDVHSSLHAARAQAHPDDLILICGSVFVVSELRG